MSRLINVGLSQYGITEIPGDLHNPEVMKYFHDTGSEWVSEDETPWCLSGDIEVLTDVGFVRLDDEPYKSKSIAQLNTTTGTVEFTSEYGYIKKEYKGELYNINKKSINISCDPNHEFYGKWSSSEIYQKRKISTLTSYGVAIPTISAGVNEYPISDRDLKLLGAFLSDGHKSFNRINIGVSKKRKIKALSKLNPLTEKNESKTYGNRKLRRSYSFAYPKIFNDILKDYKVLNFDFISSLSQRQCKLFIDNYVIYDGSSKEKSYELFTACRKLADNLIYIANMAGYKSTIFKTKQVSLNTKIDYLYSIYISLGNKHKYIQPHHVEKTLFDGFLYCMEVPSGVFIIRDRTGNIIPIGNCSAFVNWVAMRAGYEMTKKLNARSWLDVGEHVVKGKLGDVVIFWRRGNNSPYGHVGFFINEDDYNFWILGGNQSNKVCIQAYDRGRLLGIRRLKKIEPQII